MKQSGGVNNPLLGLSESARGAGRTGSVARARRARRIGAEDRHRAVLAVETQLFHRKPHLRRLDMALDIDIELRLFGRAGRMGFQAWSG